LRKKLQPKKTRRHRKGKCNADAARLETSAVSTLINHRQDFLSKLSA